MKKVLSYLSLAAILFCSCTKDQAPLAPIVYTGIAEQLNSPSKSFSEMNIGWNSDQKAYIVIRSMEYGAVDAGTWLDLISTSQGGSVSTMSLHYQNTDFEHQLRVDYAQKPTYLMAIYPATEPQGHEATREQTGRMETEGTMFKDVDLPRIQLVGKMNYDPRAVIKIYSGWSTDKSLDFKNAVSLIKVTIKEGCQAKSIRISTSDSGHKLSGVYDVRCTLSGNVCRKGYNDVVMRNEQNSPLAPGSYYVAVWPGHIDHLTLASYSDLESHNKIKEVSVSNADLTLARNEVFGDFEF